MSLRALFDVPAPAKLNLFLHVVGRRDDGLHLLQSLFVLIDWADTLHFEGRQDGRIQRHDRPDPDRHCSDEAPPLPADDLCVRAAKALQSASGTRLGADIHLEKRVPSGAGMGGGSSDAASTLLALNRLWGLHWPRERLLALALGLGADVPFFVGGRNAFVEGVGERLTQQPAAPQWLAVVKPAASLATAEIFRSPDLRRDTEAAILSGSLAEACCRGDWGRNDLQPPAERLCPDVAAAARVLQRLFGNSRMTGSGSAVFARAGTGDLPVATLPAQPLVPGWVGRMCRSLTAHPLLDWADDVAAS